MFGWKLVEPQSAEVYPSAFVRDPAHVVTYAVGFATERPDAPLFFFGDDLDSADLLLWPLHQEYPVVLLRVEARGPVREMRLCADVPSEYGAFWEAVLNGQAWPDDKAFLCPPKTLAAPAIVPLSVVWQGSRQGRSDAEMLTLIEQAMNAVREPVVEPDVHVYFPTISAGGTHG